MGSTFLSAFGWSPGPMTLASSMFTDSETEFIFPSFSPGSTSELSVAEFQQHVFTLPAGISPSCFLDSVSLTSSIEISAEHQSPLHSTEQEPVAKTLASEVAISAKQADNDKPSEDGYNWRKYGQKQGKERERGYFRCSIPDCPVKKIVEWSVDGVVDSITYSRQHNHQLPLHTYKRGRHAEPRLVATDGQGREERNTKKRNEEAAASYRPSREPKIIVQTDSAVDLLDDGFRWRKYGQKVVKCNPHPRSYYRCTTPGCNVRKQVERAATNHKAVITIYEGRHNHEVPFAKNTMS